MSIVISLKNLLVDFVLSIYSHNSVLELMDPREGPLFPGNTARILLSAFSYDKASVARGQ